MKTLKFLGLMVLSALAIGCTATQQAASQPTAKDLSVLDPGTSRDLVILELGAPAENRTGIKKIDLFSFIRYSKGTRMRGPGPPPVKSDIRAMELGRNANRAKL